MGTLPMGGMCANVGVSGCRWWHRAYARVYIQSCGRAYGCVWAARAYAWCVWSCGRGVASPIRVAVMWPCAVCGGCGAVLTVVRSCSCVGEE